MVLLRNTIIEELHLKDFLKLKMFHVKHFDNYKISDQSFKTYLTSFQYKVLGIVLNCQKLRYSKRFSKIFRKKTKNLLGYVVLLVNQEEADIIYIYVLSKYRRQGLASKLINVSRETFCIEKIFLEVNVNNFHAIAFYKTFGFTTLSIRKKYLNGQDAHLMSKTF
jgi:ribosomal protein S18 acetylase RimI-like enzyme